MGDDPFPHWAELMTKKGCRSTEVLGSVMWGRLVLLLMAGFREGISARLVYLDTAHIVIPLTSALMSDPPEGGDQTESS
ncbi:hypothetical protein P7K49_036610 [Saguinus oedipus]|uniref:Uncharacterized protein n=1 Tax=Saguinus oedipus TaxID=9490 RepID=A0ABQ9TKK6_SAGOE|nr:hypothetical protein P7K49_036610 [Saguinus oedipus]